MCWYSTFSNLEIWKMSLNINKESNANNEDIIEFISSQVKDVEYEVLSEEIMFRIPKSSYSNENLNS